MKRLSYYIALLAAVLLSACSGDDAVGEDLQSSTEEPLPDGMGRIRITIATPEHVNTRAVNANPWEDPDHEWERLQTFRIFICKASNNEVVQIISGDKTQMTAVTGSSHPYKQSEVLYSDPLEEGSYHIFATANYADGYAVGSTIDPDVTVKFPNGYSSTSADYFGEERNIPMTGRLTNSNGSMMPIGVANGITADAGTITVWRVIGKMQFYFANETSEKVRIKGIEVEPVNLASSGPGIYLFSRDDLTSTANLLTGEVSLPEDVDTGRVVYTPAAALELDAKNDANNTDEGTLFFYINETDATYTTTQNQLSLRFHIERQKPGTTGENASHWYDDEIRYGVTTNYVNNSNDYNGFNVIRRNDWIHIPVALRDWTFRVEPLAFVPIAGYPAVTLSSDALTTTFSTGGYIILQPFAQKNNDGTWRDFSDPEVTFVSMSWKNSDGNNVSGSGKIFVSPLAYDPVTKCITGELNNNLAAGTYMTTVTVNTKLGLSGSQFDYSFTFNIVLKKTTN